MHILPADSVPLPLEMPRVRLRARFHSHQNSAVVDASFVLLGALLREAPVAKRSNKAHRPGSGDTGCQCYGNSPTQSQPQNRERQEAARGYYGRHDGAYGSPDGPAKLATLCCFAGQLGIDLTIIREVLSTGVIGHDYIDVF